jgi:S-DNA-T family DNA segregation ATPase FtsK/SpoIIIE
VLLLPLLYVFARKLWRLVEEEDGTPSQRPALVAARACWLFAMACWHGAGAGFTRPGGSLPASMGGIPACSAPRRSALAGAAAEPPRRAGPFSAAAVVCLVGRRDAGRARLRARLGRRC